MSDLIDRQQAIDAINSWRGRFSEEYNEAIDDCENSIKELPTIQPEERTEKRMEMHACDLISRQALCEYALNQKDTSVTPNDIMRFPSAQPEPHEGHWIWVAGELMCSECRTIYSDLYPDYDNAVACPHCGCKMEVEHDSDLHAE